MPTDTLNDTYRRTDVGDWPTDPNGELPEQMGGVRLPTLMPGTDTFRLPLDLARLWSEFETEDKRAFLPTRQPNPTFGQRLKRWQLKCDRSHPLVIVGGPHDGEPMTANFSTNPRARGKADDPSTPWISDAQYLLFVALKDRTQIDGAETLKATINKYAGHVIRLEHGLSAQCRPDKVRYIAVNLDGNDVDMLDPSGRKGCGKRYYTTMFKDDQPTLDNGQPNPHFGKYDDTIACVCGEPTPEEAERGAQPVQVVLRGFPNVEKILSPA